MPQNVSKLPVKDLSAENILQVPEASPEFLFEPDREQIKQRYRELALAWYPDKSNDPRAGLVFSRIAALKDLAVQNLELGTWETPGEVIFTDTEGKRTRLNYAKKHEFELGEMYIGQRSVTFTVKRQYRDLFDNGVRAIEALRLPDEIKDKCQPFVPQIERILQTKDRKVLVVKKDPKMVLLQDLLNSFGEKLEPKHAAWVLSRLHYTANILNYNGLAHNGISPTTVFVGTEDHSAALLGGWWYTVSHNRSFIGLPESTVKVASTKVLSDGVADMRLDLSLIRSVGKAMLGDKVGMSLTRDPLVPKAMADWLTLPPTDNALKDFEAWQRVLEVSFGERRFVEMAGKSFSDIYQR